MSGSSAETWSETEAEQRPIETVSIGRSRGRVLHRPRSTNGPAFVALGVLLVIAAGLGVSMVGQDGIDRMLRGQRVRRQKPQREVAMVVPPEREAASSGPTPETQRLQGRPETRRPETRFRSDQVEKRETFEERSTRSRDTESPDTETAESTRFESQPRTTPPPPPVPPPPPPTLTDADRREIDERLARALQAIRDQDFPAATAALAVAATRATIDPEADERVSRWTLFKEYAQQVPRHCDDALRAAGAGREYEVNGRRMVVVEVDAERFIYRDLGGNITVPRAEIPEPFLQAIIETWFAAADQAGNHMLLGALHLMKRKPDLAAARGEWSEAARRGEATGRTLLPLLRDPVMVAGGAP